MTTRSKEEAVDIFALDSVGACNKPFKLELLHPVTKRSLGQYVFILGRDSDRMQEFNDEKFERDQRLAALNAQRGGIPIMKTREQLRAEGVDLLIALTVDFENITFKGSPLKFSHQACKELYAVPWVRDQVDNAVMNLANFIET